MLSPRYILRANKVMQKLFDSQTFVGRVMGQWHTFQDEPGSRTCQVVYYEMSSGIYDLQQDLNPGDVVVDVGAHVGMFTIPLATRNPGVKFICLEPDPNNFRNLMHNTKKAGLSNVLLLHMGLWSEECELANGDTETGNTGSNKTKPVPSGDCPGMSWQTFRELFGLTDIKVLKMDCEGAEYHIIQKPSDLKGVGEILAEIHASGDIDEMISLLEQVELSRLQIIPKQGRHYERHNGKPWTPGDRDNRCVSCGSKITLWDVALCPKAPTGHNCVPW